MSRAFMKEQEDGEPRCPVPRGCGGLGVAVTRATLVAQLPAAEAARLSDEAYYCADPGCDVGYFDRMGTIVTREHVQTRAWPKHEDAAVCSCFEFTRVAIQTQVDASSSDGLKRMLARTESTEARCVTKAPDGKRCTQSIRRIVMEHKGL